MTDNPLADVLPPMGALLVARHEDSYKTSTSAGFADSWTRLASYMPRSYACVGSVGLRTRPTRFKTLAGPSFLRVVPVILTRWAHQAG